MREIRYVYLYFPIQVSLKAETDMAMKLLEKDIHEKQDTIISLRRQLEDIKQINLEMYNKLQVCVSPKVYLFVHFLVIYENGDRVSALCKMC